MNRWIEARRGQSPAGPDGGNSRGNGFRPMSVGSDLEACRTWAHLLWQLGIGPLLSHTSRLSKAPDTH